MPGTVRPLALVIGASSNIGYEWAKSCAKNKYDLIIASDDPKVHDMARYLREMEVDVEDIEADMGSIQDVEKILGLIDGRNVSALLIHAEPCGTKDFLKDDMEELRHVVNANTNGTLYLVQTIARNMAAQKTGLIMFEGPVERQPLAAGGVESGIKAFLNAFSTALRQELSDAGITVVHLMPGETGSQYIERSNIQGGNGQYFNKFAPANLAGEAFKELFKTSNEVIAGWQNMMQAAMAPFSSAEVSSAIKKAQQNLAIKKPEEIFDLRQWNPFAQRSSRPQAFGDREQPQYRDEYEEDRLSRGGYERSSERRGPAAYPRPRDEEGRFMNEGGGGERYHSREGWSDRGEDEDVRYSRSRGGASRKRQAAQERPGEQRERFISGEEAQEERAYYHRSRGTAQEQDEQGRSSRVAGADRSTARDYEDDDYRLPGSQGGARPGSGSEWHSAPKGHTEAGGHSHDND